MTTAVFLWKNYTKGQCPRPVAAAPLLMHSLLQFPPSVVRYLKTEGLHMDKQTEELRAKYMNNPPEGMTAEDIRQMSDDDLLDMDYFLNEDNEDVFGAEGFYIF